LSRAEATRQAITETAERERRRSGLAAEARRLMQDKDAVIVQADDLLALSTVAMCPTSRSAFEASFHRQRGTERAGRLPKHDPPGSIRQLRVHRTRQWL
jgi:hypothetical protein